MFTSRFLVWVMRGFALFFTGIAIAVALSQIPGYQADRNRLPYGQVVAAISVGGLTREAALRRVEEAYNLPIEIHYGEAVFQVLPKDLGFSLDPQTMLDEAASGVRRTFWDYLWGRAPQASQPVELKASVDDDTIRRYLREQVSARYDSPAYAPAPRPGEIEFPKGMPGQAVDIERGVAAVEAALRSPTHRIATLESRPVPSAKPLLSNLEVMLKQQIALAGFNGIAELYLAGMKSGEKLHFTLQAGQPVTNGVAFTAASTIKIPVMISVFRHTSDPTPDDVLSLLRAMIDASDNPSTDRVVQSVLDENLGPLQVTEDIQKLGLESTFWAGYFYDGAPLLQSFTTPANSRQDVNAQPDIYNQTTPEEMGRLLEGIYRCAEGGGGLLVSTFPGEITQAKCTQMIELMKGNRIAVLLEAGLPEGTPIAHKHGWVQGPDGVMHDIADAGIIFTPGEDYLLTVYLHDTQQLLFDPANLLVARLSRAVYNYFNTQ